MEQRNLGRSGLLVSVVGLGCNNFGMRLDTNGTRAVIDKAIDIGITLFDTADYYGGLGGSEKAMGEVLGTRRKDIVLATKFGLPMDNEGKKKGASRRYILQAVEASLERLQTDWIDLYQIHFPDPQAPMDETLRALDDLIQQGKVRYIGCSNHAAWQIVEAHFIARDLKINHFISCQDEYSLVERKAEAELIPAARQYGLGLLPYFPLASGLLTGKYKRGAKMSDDMRLSQSWAGDRYLNDTNWGIVERLSSYAESHGRSLLELAMSWLLAKEPVASVIAGATKPEQVETNAKSVAWKLTPAEVTEIDALAKAT